jgi:hypothetical protein
MGTVLHFNYFILQIRNHFTQFGEAPNSAVAMTFIRLHEALVVVEKLLDQDLPDSLSLR